MLIELGRKGEAKQVQHLPIGSLKAYGTNPFGDATFRVIWSESRTYMVGANHVDYDGDMANEKMVKAHGGKDPNVRRQTSEYRWLPLYPAAKCWILEQWKSGIAFTGCTPAQYYERYLDPRSGLLTLGPYPDRGEYTECFRFPSEPPISAVVRVINAIRAGWNYSVEEHRKAIESEQEAKKKASADRAQDIFLDSQQAFKNRPSNIRPGKRTKEQVIIRKTAEQVGLHQRGFSTGAPPAQ